MRAELMTWPQIGEYFKKHDTVLIAVGSMENHGRQLPVGTDTLIPNKIIEILEPKCDWLIAPTIPYGCCEYFKEFPGTINLGEEAFYLVLKKVIEGYYSHGARHFAILNGHGGNDEVIEKIGYELRYKGALLTKLDWWNQVWDLNKDWVGGHGGAEETAGVMAIDENLIDKSQIDDMNIRESSPNLKTVTFMTQEFKGVKVSIPRMVSEMTDNGWRGPDHPKYATKEWGTEMLNSYADFLVEYLEEFKKLPLEQNNLVKEYLKN